MIIIYVVEISVRLPEWFKGADLRSAGFGRVGSNPTPYRYFKIEVDLKFFYMNVLMTTLYPYLTDFYKIDILVILVIAYVVYYYTQTYNIYY